MYIYRFCEMKHIEILNIFIEELKVHFSEIQSFIKLYFVQILRLVHSTKYGVLLLRGA